MPADSVTLTVKVIAKTDKAIRIDDLFQKPWLPVSQMLDPYFDLDEIEEGDEIEITIPLWLARAKEMVE